MTDANLLYGSHPTPQIQNKTDLYSLGRLIPAYFPSIFGPNEDLPLDREVVTKRFEELTAQICADTGRSMTAHEVANGFIDIANESMCRPIRALTEARGFETSEHILSSFGGAGGQHACEIAAKLGINRVVIHKYSSILSAYGMALAEVVQEAQEPSSEVVSEDSLPRVQERFKTLRSQVRGKLLEQNIPEDAMVYEPFLNLLYHGTDTNFMIEQPVDGDWRAAMEREYLRELSFVFPKTRPLVIDDIRIRGVGRNGATSHDNERLVKELAQTKFATTTSGQAQAVRTSITLSCDGNSLTLHRLRRISAMPACSLPGCTYLTASSKVILFRVPPLSSTTHKPSWSYQAPRPGS